MRITFQPKDRKILPLPVVPVLAVLPIPYSTRLGCVVGNGTVTPRKAPEETTATPRPVIKPPSVAPGEGLFINMQQAAFAKQYASQE
jgi:hypothetical protein